MALTDRQLNRATLERQLLLRREPMEVAEAVRRIGGLQAQQPASPYLALWNRLAGFDPADLDAAFTDRAVVKASLMRLTLHAVHADDYPAFHSAMLPSLRASRLADKRYTSTGLTPADADAVLRELLTFAAEPRSRDEIDELIEAQLGEEQPRMWWALKTFAPLHHVPTGGPWSFEGPLSFVAARAEPDPEPHDEAVQALLLSYLRAFGPATRKDLAQATMLRSRAVKEALQALGDQVEEMEGPDGATLVDVPGAPRPSEDTVAPPRLLGMWDSILLAYADRSRVIPPDHRSLVIRRNGDVLPTLLVDGYVAGVWRPVEDGIEATAFEPLDADAWNGLDAEARALVAFLAERGPSGYHRYDHWWRKGIPAAEVRMLGA